MLASVSAFQTKPSLPTMPGNAARFLTNHSRVFIAGAFVVANLVCSGTGAELLQLLIKRAPPIGGRGFKSQRKTRSVDGNRIRVLDQQLDLRASEGSRMASAGVQRTIGDSDLSANLG